MVQRRFGPAMKDGQLSATSANTSPVATPNAHAGPPERGAQTLASSLLPPLRSLGGPFCAVPPPQGRAHSATRSPAALLAAWLPRCRTTARCSPPRHPPPISAPMVGWPPAGHTHPPPTPSPTRRVGVRRGGLPRADTSVKQTGLLTVIWSVGAASWLRSFVPVSGSSAAAPARCPPISVASTRLPAGTGLLVALQGN